MPNRTGQANGAASGVASRSLPRQRRRRESDPLSLSLEDVELRAEVDLTANLIVAANQSTGRLTPEQIDEALGLWP